MNTLQDRRAWITGASSGIGSATARVLSAAGAEVVLSARRADKIEALAREIRSRGGVALVRPLDVTDKAASGSAASWPGREVFTSSSTMLVSCRSPPFWRTGWRSGSRPST